MKHDQENKDKFAKELDFIDSLAMYLECRFPGTAK
jgi:hypothetical protein